MSTQVQSEPTLLQKALAAKSRKRIGATDAERTELSLAWARGEITMTQVAEALGLNAQRSGNDIYRCLAFGLRGYFNQDKSL